MIFISQINRNGSGTTPVCPNLLNTMMNNELCKNDLLKIHRLSMSENTYIAIGFNSFVVKLKIQD